MNRNTGTKLHSVIDALRAIGASEPAMGNDGDGWDAAHAKLCGYARTALDPQTLAELTLLADDIEQDGIGGPFATHLANRIAHETDEAKKEYFRRLLGNVKKFNQEYAA